MNAYRMPLDNGRTLIVFSEKVADLDPETNAHVLDSGRECSGDHDEISGACIAQEEDER